MENSNLRKKLILIIIGFIFIISSIVCRYLSFNDLPIYFLDLIGVGIILFSSSIKQKSAHQLSIKEISLIGVQGAISALLYIFVKFNLPIFPQFLDIQVSEIPALITSFMYGPSAGCFVILIRFILKLPFSSTEFVGELADLIIGLVLVYISGAIYKKKRTLKGALLGLSLAMILSTIVAMLSNLFILIPFYLQLFFNGSMKPLLAMCSMIPNINENNFMTYYLFIGVLPFNLFRFLIVFILTFLLYKRINFLFKKITK